MKGAPTSLAQRTTDALVWSYVGATARISAQLFIQILLARLLGPAEFGQASLVLVVLGLGWLLADVGFGSALVQKADLTSRDVGFVLGWVLLLSAALGSIVAGAATHLAGWMGAPTIAGMIAFCGLLIPLQALSNISLSLMRRELEARRQQVISTGAYLVGYGGVGFALAATGFGAWSIIVGFAAQTVLVLVLGYLAVRHTLRPTLHGDASLRRFGLAVLGTNVANWAIDGVDRLVIGRIWGIEAVGAYSVSANLARAPATFIAGSAQAVVLAASSRIQSDHARVADGFFAGLGLLSLVVLPLFSQLAVQADTAVVLLYGSKWTEAGALLSAASVAMIPYSIMALAGPTLAAVGRPATEMKIQAAVAVLLCAGLVALAAFPISIAVWMVPAVYLLRAAWLLAALARALSFDVVKLGRPIARGALLSAFGLVAVLIARDWLPSPGEVASLETLVGAFVMAAVFRIRASLFIGDELMSALASRAQDSPWVAFGCRVAGIRLRGAG